MAAVFLYRLLSVIHGSTVGTLAGVTLIVASKDMNAVEFLRPEGVHCGIPDADVHWGRAFRHTGVNPYLVIHS